MAKSRMKKSIFPRIILCLFALSHSAYVLPVNNIQYIKDSWDIEDGLPQNIVYSAVQSKEGYLWFGTTKGIVRFDGIRFTAFNTKNTDQFRTDRILCILSARDGSLWIGTEGGGLVKHKGNNFHLYTTEDGLTSNYISYLFQDSTGDIWVGTPDEYLNCYKDEHFIQYKSGKGLENNYVKTIYEDNSGYLWVATIKGLYRKENDFFHKITLPNYPSGLAIRALYQEKSGTTWIGSNKGLFMVAADQPVFSTEEKDKIIGNSITAINQDLWGNMWIGAENCLYILEKKEEKNYLIHEMLHKISITNILIDHENSIWIATLGKGIKRFRRGKFRSYTIQKGLSSNLPMSLCEDMNGNLWVGLNNGDINILNPGDIFFKNIFSDKLNNNDSVRAIVEADNGDIWFSSYGNGIYCYDTAENLTNFTESDGLINNIVRTLFIDSSGVLWIGTRYGLSVLKNGKFKSYTTENGLPSNIILCVSQDETGRIWAGTGKGLAYLIDGRFQSASYWRKLQDYPILCIYPDENNVIWIGTEGGGIFRIKNIEIDNITEENELPSNIVSAILKDSRGQYWLTTDKGILLVSQTEMVEVCSGRKKTLFFKLYGISEGLPSDECVKFSQYAALKRKDHSLWFATMDGLGVLNTETVFFNKKPPPVRIEKIEIDENFVELPLRNKAFVVKNQISFYFTALSFISSDKIRFRYILENKDKDWSEIIPGKDRWVSYSNLRSGEYTFRITACNRDGIWNPEGDEVSFNISIPFTRTLLFRVLMISLILGMGVFLFLVYIRKIKIFPIIKYKSSSLSSEQKEEYLQKIKTALEQEEFYKEENVSLEKLANILSLPPHHISQVINERMEKNFNDLINYYRIEEAKRILKDLSRERTILEIAFDVGFNSKTSFNRAFKKYTSMTPSQFRNRCKSQ
ncbi:MAG: two-component regulator propeller domain-containing protein [bacterium]